MFVDIEFFGEDPIDNVISCLKFKFDKVVFLGYAKEDMDFVSKETVERFLRSNRIGIRNIQFIAIPSPEYQKAQDILTDVVRTEQAAGNKCYMDLSGGDETVLAAAGVVATQFGIPMHEIDVVADKVNILRGAEQYDVLQKRNLYLDIEEFLNLHEAVIDWSKTVPLEKGYFSDVRKQKIREIRKFTVTHRGNWNRFSLGFAKLCSKQSTHIYRAKKEINRAANIGKLKPELFLSNIEALRDKGFLTNYFYDGEIMEFDFSDDWEKELLCNAGATLEHYVCAKVLENLEINDCGMNYYLDWEGDGNPRHRNIGNRDVINEIDVVYMKKNIPTFISCKNFHVKENQVLYELETVANRFGGANVRKVLVADGGVGPSILERAEEMDIQVIRPEDM